MKRAKITLTVIAVLAIVGGAMAFKAQRFAKVFKTGPDGACTLVVDNYTLQPIANVQSFEGLYTTLEKADCVQTTIYFRQ